jgi:archaellum component FlaC
VITLNHDGPVESTTSSEHLRDLTSRGWMLVAMVQESAAVPLGRRHPYGGDLIQERDERGNAIPTRLELGTVTRYLLTRSKDATLAELRAANEEFHAELTKVQNALEEKQRWLTTAQEALNEKEKARQLLASRVEAQQTALHDDHERMRKMERDLAKVRDEIGAARWKEIVG